MEDLLARFFPDLIGRFDGPLSFRVVLQPLMAIAFAIHDGRRDAREGRPPYFWALFTVPGHRIELLRDGWRGVHRVYLLALVLDVVYTFIVFRLFLPGQSLVVAGVLALVPYMLMRGPANRLYARWIARKVHAHEQHHG